MMADNHTVVPLPGIAALPPNTARQIGSGQVLVDSSSAVKELIDNALDARAKNIVVDLTANTIDSIQVKDDGHGIPAEDRTLMCRQYCTSKIRDIDELKEIGGRWLGFRGEALSSIAEMSGTISVITKVEGEPVAVRLKYSRDGELATTELDSHPVGTTVKLTHFFEYMPVRKQTAIKNSARCLAKIRRLLQAYVLARPAIRFRLHVLQAKNNKADFIYVPKASPNVGDAVLKAIGKDCALECERTTLRSDGFEIYAFLPKPTANGSKIASHGAFISIDSRPVSNSRGTIKQMGVTLKERLRKSNASLATVKDPFFCMNVICPPDSYDPNIEPAKDDVMFENGAVVLKVLDKLLWSYYPESVVKKGGIELLTPAQQTQMLEDEQIPMSTLTPTSVYEDFRKVIDDASTFDARLDQAQWRSSMYEVENDDLEFLQENMFPVIEEEDGSQAADVSNPWAIARMNALVKSSRLMTNGQLMSPAKSHDSTPMQPSSLAPLMTPARKPQSELLTPQTSSRVNAHRSSLNNDLEQNTHRLPLSTSEGRSMDELGDSLSRSYNHLHSSTPYQVANGLSVGQNELQEGLSGAGQRPLSSSPSIQARDLYSHKPYQASQGPRSSQRKQPPCSDELSDASICNRNESWFGQSTRTLQPWQPPSRKKHSKKKKATLFPNDVPSSSYGPILTTAERRTEDRLYSKNNTDIRKFFPRNKTSYMHGFEEQLLFDSSRAPTEELVVPSESTRAQSQTRADNESDHQARDTAIRIRGSTERGRPSSQPSSSRVTSYEPLPLRFRDAPRVHSNHIPSLPAYSTKRRFQPYDNAHTRMPMPRPFSVSTERSSSVPGRSNEAIPNLDLYHKNRFSQDHGDMNAYFKGYQGRVDAPLDRSISQIGRQEPQIAPAHELASTSCPKSRQITDGTQRTKSSTLLLERVPHGYHIQGVVLAIQVSIALIVMSSRKLDMGCNSLKWGYSPREAYDTFADPVSAKKVMDWVLNLDGTLQRLYGRLPGVDVCSLLHEGIQMGLDGKKGDDAMQTVENAEVSGPVTGGHVDTKVSEDVPDVSQRERQVSVEAEEQLSEFDMSQFVDFDAQKLDDGETYVSTVVSKVENEYDNDFEDDMLMDL